MRIALVVALSLSSGCASSSPSLEKASIGNLSFGTPSGWTSRDVSNPQRKMFEWSPADNERKESLTVIRSDRPAMAKASQAQLQHLMRDAQRAMPEATFSAPLSFTTRHGFQGVRIEGSFTAPVAGARYRRIHAAFVDGRGYLTQRREQMAGQTDCTANAADLVTSYLRDSALRLTKLTRPDGSCLIYEYDTRGRLLKTKRRDDCNAATSGDRQEYTYSDDGLITKTETFDAGGVVTKRQELTYRDSRRLEKMLNPVNTAKWTGITYTARGLVDTVSAVDGASELSKTSWTYNADARVASEKRFSSTGAFDTWNVLFDWLGNQASVTDGDSKTTGSTRDDLGRLVLLSSPDLGGYPSLRVYDGAGRLVTLKESIGGASAKEHSFSYDNLGRPLVSDYQTPACKIVDVPEVVRVYDCVSGQAGCTSAAPACPAGTSCTNQKGRLAYVKARHVLERRYQQQRLHARAGDLVRRRRRGAGHARIHPG